MHVTEVVHHPSTAFRAIPTRVNTTDRLQMAVHSKQSAQRSPLLSKRQHVSKPQDEAMTGAFDDKELPT